MAWAGLTSRTSCRKGHLELFTAEGETVHKITTAGASAEPGVQLMLEWGRVAHTAEEHVGGSKRRKGKQGDGHGEDKGCARRRGAGGNVVNL